MNFENLIVNLSNHVFHVIINRPNARNAMDLKTWKELSNAIDIANETDDVKVVVITGAGDDAFAAGADAECLQQKRLHDIFKVSGQTVCNKIHDCSKPVIAAINGDALGKGCEIALASDFRYATENAEFGFPEINFGIIPGGGATQRLSRLVGESKAKELIFTGETISAHEALEIGLIDKVVKQDDLMNEVIQMANKIKSKPTLAVQMAKSAINTGLATDIHTGLSYELTAQAILYGTEEKKEAVEAYLKNDASDYI